jgi:hypothetical protein
MGVSVLKAAEGYFVVQTNKELKDMLAYCADHADEAIQFITTEKPAFLGGFIWIFCHS